MNTSESLWDDGVGTARRSNAHQTAKREPRELLFPRGPDGMVVQSEIYSPITGKPCLVVPPCPISNNTCFGLRPRVKNLTSWLLALPNRLNFFEKIMRRSASRPFSCSPGLSSVSSQPRCAIRISSLKPRRPYRAGHAEAAKMCTCSALQQSPPLRQPKALHSHGPQHVSQRLDAFQPFMSCFSKAIRITL